MCIYVTNRNWALLWNIRLQNLNDLDKIFDLSVSLEFKSNNAIGHPILSFPVNA